MIRIFLQSSVFSFPEVVTILKRTATLDKAFVDGIWFQKDPNQSEVRGVSLPFNHYCALKNNV